MKVRVFEPLDEVLSELFNLMLLQETVGGYFHVVLGFQLHSLVFGLVRYFPHPFVDLLFRREIRLTKYLVAEVGSMVAFTFWEPR